MNYLPEILHQYPEFVQMQFPAFLMHKSAILLDELKTYRSLFAEKATLDRYVRSISERHHQELAQRELSYLSYVPNDDVTDVFTYVDVRIVEGVVSKYIAPGSLYKSGVSPDPKKKIDRNMAAIRKKIQFWTFPTFKVLTSYRHPISRDLFTRIVCKEHESRRPFLDRMMQMNVGSVVSGDDSYKVSKRTIFLGLKKMFATVYTLIDNASKKVCESAGIASD